MEDCNRRCGREFFARPVDTAFKGQEEHEHTNEPINTAIRSLAFSFHLEISLRVPTRRKSHEAGLR